MWMVSVQSATLSDYLVLVAFMGNDFVNEAFIVYNHSQRIMQMCALIHDDEEVDVKTWFPLYAVNHCDDWSSTLDQPLAVDGLMMMGMAECDLVQCKNLENTRNRLCTRLGLTVAATSVVVEESK